MIISLSIRCCDKCDQNKAAVSKEEGEREGEREREQKEGREME